MSCVHKIPTLIVKKPEKWQSSTCGKTYKQYSEDYIQPTCSSSDHDQNSCEVSKDLTLICRRSYNAFDIDYFDIDEQFEFCAQLI